MKQADVVFDGNRRLLIVPWGSWVATAEHEFVALAPAWTTVDIDEAKAHVASLLAPRSCLEICCVGPRSEELHDAMDDAIEDAGQLSVVTTWDNDPADGYDYFLRFASLGPRLLVAFASAHPELVQTLVRMTR